MFGKTDSYRFCSIVTTLLLGCSEPPVPVGNQTKWPDSEAVEVLEESDVDTSATNDASDVANAETFDTASQWSVGCGPDIQVRNGLPCDDGDPCTSSSECRDGNCLPLFPSCYDGDVCTIDVCTVGTCTHVPVLNDKHCQSIKGKLDCDSKGGPAIGLAENYEGVFGEVSEPGWDAWLGMISEGGMANLNRFFSSSGDQIWVFPWHVSRTNFGNSLGKAKLVGRTAHQIIGAPPPPTQCNPGWPYNGVWTLLLDETVSYLADGIPGPGDTVWVLGHGHPDGQAEEYGSQRVAADWIAQLGPSLELIRGPIVLRKHSAPDFPRDLMTAPGSKDCASIKPWDRTHGPYEIMLQAVAEGGRLVRLDYGLFAAILPTAIWWNRDRSLEDRRVAVVLFDEAGRVYALHDTGPQSATSGWAAPTFGVAWATAIGDGDIAAMLQPSGVLLRIHAADGSISGRRDPGMYGGYGLVLPSGSIRYRALVGPPESVESKHRYASIAKKAVFSQEIEPLSAAAWGEQSGAATTLVVRDNPLAAIADSAWWRGISASHRAVPYTVLRAPSSSLIVVPRKAPYPVGDPASVPAPKEYFRSALDYGVVQGTAKQAQMEYYAEAVEDAAGGAELGPAALMREFAFDGSTCRVWLKDIGYLFQSFAAGSFPVLNLTPCSVCYDSNPCRKTLFDWVDENNPIDLTGTVCMLDSAKFGVCNTSSVCVAMPEGDGP
ncbi:MAG: hypothetical protein H6747_04360 [Deltaproteobacteria bacterium]|nr:hypothetical protein [Deltaproteobacteria bacterium]